jgi:hypothetical protein
MTSRSVLLLAVLLMLALAVPAFAQPGAGGGDGARGGRMGMGSMMMMQAPTMTIADGNLYIIYMGQLSMFNAKTLELIKTVPLPMPAMGGQPGGGAPPPPPPG